MMMVLLRVESAADLRWQSAEVGVSCGRLDTEALGHGQSCTQTMEAGGSGFSGTWRKKKLTPLFWRTKWSSLYVAVV